MRPDLQNLLDAVIDGLIVLDAQGRVSQLNAEACRILEISDESAKGVALERAISPEHPVSALVRKVQKSGRASIEDDIPIARRFDEALEVDVAVSPMLDHDGAAHGTVVTLRDHTIRNSLRSLESQRDELTSYGHIAAGIAHEVKNPLGGIRGAAELLEGWAEGDRPRRAASLILREVDRIAALVDELMVFSAGDALSMAPVNIHRVLDGVLELLSHDPLGEAAAVERFYDPSIPEFLADADRLTQVFLNLARNALQAMETQGGTLTVTTRMSLDHRLSNTEGKQLPTVVVAISDCGPGIPRDQLDQLTTPFFTTRSGGTGLGLAVARHWVIAHHGTLRVSSQPGEGTTVRVALPLRRPQ